MEGGQELELAFEHYRTWLTWLCKCGGMGRNND